MFKDYVKVAAVALALVLHVEFHILGPAVERATEVDEFVAIIITSHTGRLHILRIEIRHKHVPARKAADTENLCIYRCHLDNLFVLVHRQCLGGRQGIVVAVVPAVDIVLVAEGIFHPVVEIAARVLVARLHGIGALAAIARKLHLVTTRKIVGFSLLDIGSRTVREFKRLHFEIAEIQVRRIVHIQENRAGFLVNFAFDIALAHRNFQELRGIRGNFFRRRGFRILAAACRFAVGALAARRVVLAGILRRGRTRLAGVLCRRRGLVRILLRRGRLFRIFLFGNLESYLPNDGIPAFGNNHHIDNPARRNADLVARTQAAFRIRDFLRKRIESCGITREFLELAVDQVERRHGADIERSDRHGIPGVEAVGNLGERHHNLVLVGIDGRIAVLFLEGDIVKAVVVGSPERIVVGGTAHQRKHRQEHRHKELQRKFLGYILHFLSPSKSA